jgi:hypothetical protein
MKARDDGRPTLCLGRAPGPRTRLFRTARTRCRSDPASAPNERCFRARLATVMAGAGAPRLPVLRTWRVERCQHGSGAGEELAYLETVLPAAPLPTLDAPLEWLLARRSRDRRFGGTPKPVLAARGRWPTRSADSAAFARLPNKKVAVSAGRNVGRRPLNGVYLATVTLCGYRRAK